MLKMLNFFKKEKKIIKKINISSGLDMLDR